METVRHDLFADDTDDDDERTTAYGTPLRAPPPRDAPAPPEYLRVHETGCVARLVARKQRGWLQAEYVAGQAAAGPVAARTTRCTMLACRVCKLSTVDAAGAALDDVLRCAGCAAEVHGSCLPGYGGWLCSACKRQAEEKEEEKEKEKEAAPDAPPTPLRKRPRAANRQAKPAPGVAVAPPPAVPFLPPNYAPAGGGPLSPAAMAAAYQDYLGFKQFLQHHAPR